MLHTHWLRLFALFAALALLLTACPAEEEPVTAVDEPEAAVDEPEEPEAAVDEPEEEQPYYEGKRMRIVLSSGVGGSTDTRNRLLADQLQIYIPGNPDIRVENMPGAGGAISAAYFTTRVSADGLTLWGATGSIPERWLKGEEGHDVYDLFDLRPVLSGPTATIGFARPDVASSVQDVVALDRPLTGVFSDASSGSAVVGRLVAELLGWEDDQVYGIESGGERLLMVLRGEVDYAGTDVANYVHQMTPHEEAGELVPLYQTGILEGGQLVRDPRVPDVPTVTELFEDLYDEPIEDHPAWDAFFAFTVLRSVGESLWAPADTPDDVYEILVQAAREMNDSEFYHDYVEGLTGAVDILLVGDEVHDALRIAADLPQEVIDDL